MNSADQRRFEDLLNWGREQGATIHELVEVYNDELTKFSLRVKDSAPQAPPSGFTAVTCPASATLSYLNALTGTQLPSGSGQEDTTEAEPAFPELFMDSLPPHVIGRFFLVQQYLLGEDSFWWPYIKALPQPEHLASWALPAFWPEDDIDFLEGTNAYVAIEEIQANVKREHKQARKLLKESNFPGWQDYTRLLYNWAFCMFTSRSFRPTTVLSELMQKHISDTLPLKCSFDDFSVLMPVFDIANHALTAKVVWDTASDPTRCQLKSQDTCQPGQQIFNNYGMKTNSELLLGYRFIIPETDTLHNDYIHVRKRVIEEAGAGESAAGSKPKDFLISLRPMLDASSPVGRARQQVKTTEDLKILPELAHIEDALVWDLVLAQASQDETVAKLLDSRGTADAGISLAGILASPTDPEFVSLVAKIKNSLLAKLYFDYERLKEVELDEDGERRLVPANQNQELAVAYRQQCEKVLERVLRLLHASVQESCPKLGLE